MSKLFGGQKTVIRGAYSRLFGRLNGVAQVLNPLLGAAFAQPVSCFGASITGQCLGTDGVTPQTAFRIGTDGLAAPLPATLPQPYYAGQSGNAAAADATVLDKTFRPNRSDVFDFTLQRQLNDKLTVEAGYIGRIIKNEFQLINTDAVPTMMTLGGQSFANAFANTYLAISAGGSPAVQPFFEAALGGARSGYCSGYASCTAAVAAKQKTQITGTQVYSLWSAMSNAPGWTLGRTLPSSAPAQTASIYETTSLGWGNYNAAFLSFTFRDYRGVTARSNLTFSKTLGTVGYAQSTSSTTVLDPYNLRSMYGPQPFDVPVVYNLSVVYAPKWFRGTGLLDTVLGGWSFSPENAVLRSPYTGGNSLHENVVSSTIVASAGNPSKNGSGLNIFADPNAVYNQFGRLILGLDNSSNGAGILRNFPYWNVDMQISKEFRLPFREGMGITFNAQFANLLNHFQPGFAANSITKHDLHEHR
ncbi:MAG: hypothetical protein ACJ746_08850 [Bryobacteraceae bacterium]